MANSAEQVIETVRLTTAAQNGTVVQVTGTGTVGAATTALAGVVTSSMNLASGSPANVVLVGVTSVLCVTGLTIVPGVTTLWLSSTAGKATTDPSTGIFLGVAIDASKYATKSLVSVWITASGSGSGSSAVTATWPLTTTRYYAVDYNNGSDTNIGYSDVSLAAAGAVAFKTLTKLRAAIPDLGDGRNLYIGVAGNTDGTDLQYFKPDGVTLDDLELRGIFGYNRIIVRTTKDFTDSTSDKKVCAPALGQVGPAANGAFTVAGGATTSSLTIASGTLTAEPGLNVMRVRFTGNVTASLADECVMIWKNTSTVITPGRNFSVAPAAGDTFYIERPGVSVQNIFVAELTGGRLNSNQLERPWNVIGFRARQESGSRYTGFISGPTQGRWSFMEFDYALSVRGTSDIGFSNSWEDQTGTRFTTGIGVRHQQNISTIFSGIFGLLTYTDSGIVGGGAATISRVRSYTFGTACYFSVGLTFLNCGVAGASSVSASVNTEIGNAGSTTARRIRINCVTPAKGLDLRATFGDVRGADISNCGANDAVTVTANGGGITLRDIISTDGGNTQYGIDFSNASNGACSGLTANIQGCTITGTLGDVKLADTTVVTYARITADALVDSNLCSYFDATGGTRITRKTAGIFYNVPILGADPTTPLDGDCWITNIAGTRSFCARIGGTTYRATLT